MTFSPLPVLLLVTGLLLPFGQGTLADEGQAAHGKMPPASLAQWYKPVNKRQVWLHTMFKLRREMQAVEEYLAGGDGAKAGAWAQRLTKDYLSIGTMVPEWRDELEREWAEELNRAAAAGDGETMGRALHHLNTSCDGCHKEHRAVVAALFRTPDYTGLKVEHAGGQLTYPEAMEGMSRAVNRIAIALADGATEAARGALGDLSQRLEGLRPSCGGCHRDAPPAERILGASTRDTVERLEASIVAGDAKGSGRLLGELAVVTCARCHGVHRTLGDIAAELRAAQGLPGGD